MLAGVSLHLVLSACGSAPTYAIHATVLGQNVQTTVDSEIARFYAERYWGGLNDKPELTQRITALHTQQGTGIPSRSELNTIAQAFSVDFAALFLAHQLMRNDCNREINDSFNRVLKDKGANAVDPSPYLVLFVPGWDYAENGHATGADFAQPRRLMTALSMENHLVALAPTGSVEDNAIVFTREVVRHAHSGKQIIIAGASSAGPAIHLALAEHGDSAAFKSVKAWLNLGGILQGSPLIDHFDALPHRWLRDAVAWYMGWDVKAIESMSASTARARFQRLRLSQPPLIINYLGIPLSGQVSRHAADKYPLLRAQGPNDGLTLLTDAIAPNSLTVVALGSDHFFAEDPRISDKTVALMKLIVSRLQVHATSSAQTCQPTQPD